MVVVGVTSYFNWRDNALALRMTYVRKLSRLGAVPLVIPPDPSLDVGEVLERVDAVLLSGGGDVDPRFYGEEPRRGMGRVEPGRDELEIRLVREAFSRGKPLLAICRGIQVVNVALGGTLYQDIELEVPNAIKHRWIRGSEFEVPMWYPVHWVEIDTGSRLFRILGTRRLLVNSFHHQAVKRVAPVLRPVAWAPDGVVEAVEAPHHPFFIGVQWHPEAMDDEYSWKLFQAFVDAARR